MSASTTTAEIMNELARPGKSCERLSVLIDYPASPGCTPPYAPVWITDMVRRREAVKDA